MYPWLHLGPVYLSTYSLLFLAAFMVGGYITYRQALRLGRGTEEMLQVALAALGGGLVGAKLSMLIFLGPGTFIKDLPVLWYSGQAWTGGFFGGYAGVLLIKHWRHITYSTGDVFALGLPIAQAIGRMGNLLGGDPMGLPSSLPWAVMTRAGLRQPSPLYELILDLALAYFILRLRDHMPRAGDLFKFYIVGYCSLRFIVDFTRDDPRFWLNLTLVQLLYVPAILGFGWQLLRSYQLQQAALRTAPLSVTGHSAEIR